MTGDQSVNDRMAALAAALLEATRARAVSWAVADQGGAFVYTGTDAAVTISEIDDGGDCVIALLNKGGATLCSLRAGPGEVIAELLDAARRAAYDIDNLIDGLTADIQRVVPFRAGPQKAATGADDDLWSAERDF